MVNLMDIYYKVGMSLAEQDFDFQEPEVKKQLVDTSLKTYLIEKISEINSTPALTDPENKISTEDLVDELGELISQENHFDTLRHLTHFILNIAGKMQSWSIVWYSEKDSSFIDNPLVVFNDNGKWESLTTHETQSYVQTFHQVYGAFKEVFMTKTKSPQLTIGTKQLLENNE